MFEILEKVCTPTKGTKFSACVDLYAREDVVIGAGETVLAPLGVKIDLEKLKNSLKEDGTLTINHYYDFMASHQLNLHIRSSMSAKHGLIIANGTGIIDLDYEDEIMICIYKPVKLEDAKQFIDLEEGKGLGKVRESSRTIRKGDKIAQISLVEHKTYLLGVESKEKRIGGFGSTSISN